MPELMPMHAPNRAELRTQDPDTCTISMQALAAVDKDATGASSRLAAGQRATNRRQLLPANEPASHTLNADRAAASDHTTHLPAAALVAMAPLRSCGSNVLLQPTTSSSSAKSGQDCRICLSGSKTADLIQPCGCVGTLRYTHASCLAAWVQQRQHLTCELCRWPYKESHMQMLAPLIVKTAKRGNQRAERVAAAAEGASSHRQPATLYQRACLTPAQWFYTM